MLFRKSFPKVLPVPLFRIYIRNAVSEAHKTAIAERRHKMNWNETERRRLHNLVQELKVGLVLAFFLTYIFTALHWLANPVPVTGNLQQCCGSVYVNADPDRGLWLNTDPGSQYLILINLKK